MKTKNSLYVAFLVTMFVICLLGCRKEPSTNSVGETTNELQWRNATSKLYYVQNNMLIVNSVEDFDALIDVADEALYKQLTYLDYESYQETVVDDSLNVVDDEFLSAVLNKDFVVQIGSGYVKYILQLIC